MMALPRPSAIYLYAQPTDMRKSFDGLSGIIRSELGREPADGSLFLFINRRQDRIKALWWETDGLVLWYKRLEAGSFERPRVSGDQTAATIDATQLSLILGGVSLDAVRRRRFRSAG